nr:PASTA domain-containing protein [Actinomadura spongiicola]
MNHQKAQNAMQAVGLFRLMEEDATGQGRLLLWDRNWVVVKQRPRAGTRVTENTTITLYSKKVDE